MTMSRRWWETILKLSERLTSRVHRVKTRNWSISVSGLSQRTSHLLWLADLSTLIWPGLSPLCFCSGILVTCSGRSHPQRRQSESLVTTLFTTQTNQLNLFLNFWQICQRVWEYSGCLTNCNQSIAGWSESDVWCWAMAASGHLDTIIPGPQPTWWRRNSANDYWVFLFSTLAYDALIHNV